MIESDILRLLKLGHEFDFREVRIEYGNTLDGMHEILRERVMPAIIEMESLPAINSFHFIRHEKLDLRLSSPCWSYCEDQVTEILAKYDLPVEMHPYELGSPEKHGGEIGTLLTYNVLEHNSRVILALISAKWRVDGETTSALVSNIYKHWPHYLYCQYGFNNTAQAFLDFDSAMIWIETALARDPFYWECFEVVQHMLNGIMTLCDKCLLVWSGDEEKKG